MAQQEEEGNVKELPADFSKLTTRDDDDDVDDDTPSPSLLLHSAARLGELRIMRQLLLLDASLDVNVRGKKDGATPLHEVFYGELKPALMELLECLVSRGADVNAKDDDGLTPLHLAVANYKASGPNNFIPAVSYLIASGADVTIQEPAHGDSMLLLAPKFLPPEEYHELVRLLIERKLESAFLLRNKVGWTPLHSAILFLEELKEETLRLLTTYIDINAKGDDGGGGLTPLELAVCSGRSKEFLAMMINAGADPLSDAELKLMAFVAKVFSAKTKRLLDECDDA